MTPSQPAIKMKALGKSGIMVAPLAFGGNVFGWTADEATSFRLLDEFVNRGFNLIDTADVYSRWVAGNQGGESEAIIGRWIKKSGRRNKVVIATKVGIEMGEGKKGVSRTYINQAVEDSLRRLQTDYIDLYQAHRDVADVPLLETLEAFADLIRQGKVRAIGASNYTADRFAESLEVSKKHGLPRYESLQPNYNLYDRADFENGLESLCLKENIGVINYYSLASGFLSGKYRSEDDLSKSKRGAGVKKYLDARGMRILGVLDEVATQYRATPTQVSLAWLMARPSITAPIASATNLDQLGDLIASINLKLDQAAITRLNDASQA